MADKIEALRRLAGPAFSDAEPYRGAIAMTPQSMQSAAPAPATAAPTNNIAAIMNRLGKSNGFMANANANTTSYDEMLRAMAPQSMPRRKNWAAARERLGSSLFR